MVAIDICGKIPVKIIIYEIIYETELKHMLPFYIFCLFIYSFYFLIISLHFYVCNVWFVWANKWILKFIYLFIYLFVCLFIYFVYLFIFVLMFITEVLPVKISKYSKQYFNFFCKKYFCKTFKSFHTYSFLY